MKLLPAMRRAIEVSLLSILLLAAAPLSFAALSEYGDAFTGGSSYILMTTPITVGDLLVVGYMGATNVGTFSDTNGNSYATPVVIGPDEYGSYINLSWAINNTSTASLGVTFSGTSSGGRQMGVYGITGFTHGPIAISADVSSVVIAGTALNTAGFTASKNNEFSIGFAECNGVVLTITSGDYASNGGETAFQSLSALSTDGYSSGTNLAFTGTLASSQGAAVLIQGFYDGSVAASCANDGYTSTGAIAVPTPSSTNVWKTATGAFGTVDCATTNYYQIPSGGIGVN